MEDYLVEQRKEKKKSAKGKYKLNNCFVFLREEGGGKVNDGEQKKPVNV